MLEDRLCRTLDECKGCRFHSEKDLADLCLKAIILAAALTINCDRWQVRGGEKKGRPFKRLLQQSR